MSRSHGDRGDGSDKDRSLKKQIRYLKRENSSLQRDLRKANQRIAELQNTVIEDDDHDELPRGEGPLCTKCRKGVYVVTSLPIRGGQIKSFAICNVCKDRKPAK